MLDLDDLDDEIWGFWADDIYFLINFYWSVVKWIGHTCTYIHFLLDAIPIQVIT